MHCDRIGHGYGVSRSVNYSKHGSGTSFDKVPDDVIPQPTVYRRTAVRAAQQPGYGYQTLLVEPPIFLSEAAHRLTGAVRSLSGSSHAAAEVVPLPEPIASTAPASVRGDIFSDTNMEPIKGQLVLVKPQPALDIPLQLGRDLRLPRTTTS